MSRLLFIAEGVTLAHVARPLKLAQAMAARGHEVSLAAPERYRPWAPEGVRWLNLRSQSPESFAARLARGQRLYGQGQLKGYIADDLNLFEKVRPEVSIGDFRLSLAASARTAGIPYITISNAYWSSQRQLKPPAPALSRLNKLLFSLAWSWGLQWHAASIAEVLRAHGVDVGRSLQRAYTEADVTLYADLPALFPEVTPSEREVFLGPVGWEPPVPMPGWWGDLPADRPAAYVSMGSSGAASALPAIVAALRAEGMAVMVATAGRAQVNAVAGEVFVADYLPGGEACWRAALVVCNGGSPGAGQALTAGRPVIGVCSNLDQFLNMQAVQAHGAGVMLRSDALSAGRLRRAIRRVRGAAVVDKAAALARVGAPDPAQVLEAAISRLLAGRAGRGRRSDGKNHSRQRLPSP